MLIATVLAVVAMVPAIPFLSGHFGADIGFAAGWHTPVLAVICAALALLLANELNDALRTRVVLGSSGVEANVPAQPASAVPLRFLDRAFAYDDVETIDVRREIHGTFVPATVAVARVTLRDGTIVPLGVTGDVDSDEAFPVRRIAAAIAERARLPLIDRSGLWHVKIAPRIGVDPGRWRFDRLTEDAVAAVSSRQRAVAVALSLGVAALTAAAIVQEASGDAARRPDGRQAVNTGDGRQAVNTGDGRQAVNTGDGQQGVNSGPIAARVN
ncbi:MAG: hypothetical protein NW216_05650 [Hyphomicrobium sp.]|nr:hypothetical protein [Hyphomicrobium sp.]